MLLNSFVPHYTAVSGKRMEIDNTTYLQRTPEGLVLTNGAMTLRADFLSLLPRISHNKVHTELLVRAAKIKGESNPVVIDATAGFGEDSFLLAAAGFTVLLFEQDATISALLEDALMRAQDNPKTADIVSRMTLIKKDSISWLNEMASSPTSSSLSTNTKSLLDIASIFANPHVVYLDPMFPERSKNAAVKKKFQLIHNLEKPCENEEELLNAALTIHPKKIVIKRPLKGAFLAKRKPNYSLKGKAIRYDCIVLPPK